MSRINGLTVTALWLATVALAYLGVGGFLAERVEGIDPKYLSLVLPGAAVLGLLVSLVATVVWARRIGADGPTTDGLGRRRFLAGAGATIGGVLATGVGTVAYLRGWLTVTGPNILGEVESVSPNPRSEWRDARVRAYRRLGRTDFQVSDISLGSGRIREDNDGEAIAREAIARGVNYFDTSPDYSGASSELALGRAMKGHRDKMFLATKFCTPEGHLRQGASVAEYVEAVEASLKRLQTDYVDLVHIHSCDSVARLLDPNVHEAFAKLKQQGKVRFMGVSTHTPNLEEVANAAIDDGRFDVMMLAYHHGAWPLLGDIIDRANAKDMGIVAMKTLKGAKHHGLVGFREEADAYTQGAFKWVLSNPAVSCLVISFYEFAHVDEYLYASGKSVAKRDLAVLQKYDELTAGKHCFAHCGACLGACPEQLAINDVLRHRMYFEDYGDEKQAMELYAKLDKQADVCMGCSAPCVGACPHGIQIQERTLGAHEMLTFRG